MNSEEKIEGVGVPINTKVRPKGIDIKKKSIIIAVTVVVSTILVALTFSGSGSKKEDSKEMVNETALKNDENKSNYDALNLQSEYGEQYDKNNVEKVAIGANEKRLQDGKIQLADGTVLSEEQYIQLHKILREKYGEGQNDGYEDEGTGYVQQRVETDNSADYYSYDKEKRNDLLEERLKEEDNRKARIAEEARKELMSARTSGIGFNSKGTSTEPKDDMTSLLTEIAKSGNNVDFSQLAKLNNTQSDYEVANGQSNKKAFQLSTSNKNWYLNGDLEKAVSKYEVKAGSLIPATLVTGINSDLPGNCLALVRENIYDSINGNYLLIPKGAKLIGIYDSAITFGQVRAMVLWSRLVLPNGKSIDLEQMNGVDLSGMSGLKGKVNNHFGQLLKGVLLSSMIGAGTASLPDTNSALTGAQNGAVEATAEIAQKFTDKVLNIQPTITVESGKKFNIYVHKDMILEPYKK